LMWKKHVWNFKSLNERGKVASFLENLEHA